jgi:hypothetical protein
VNIHDLKTAYEKAIGHSTERFAEAELKVADTFAEVETLEPPTPGFGDL